MKESEGKNNAIEISMETSLNGAILETKRSMTLMTSLRSLRQNNKEMKPL